MESRNDNGRPFDMMVACCCPCIVLGNVHSVTSRETISFTCSPMDVRLGSSGLNTCLRTIPLCLLCWPLAPMLSYHVHLQREKMRIIYGEESTLDELYNVGKCCSVMFSWPSVLLENQAFLLARNEEGALRFDWEENIIGDIVRSPPKPRDRIVAILGPRQVGKSTLFKKILLQSDSSKKLEPDNKSTVGIKPYKFSEEFVDFLEVWDMATDELESKANRHIIGNAQNVIILYDCSDASGDSLAYAQTIYDFICGILNADCLVWLVANKLDLARDDRLIVEGEKWATDRNLSFQKISSIDFKPKETIF
jgi:hypothetical protein